MLRIAALCATIALLPNGWTLRAPVGIVVQTGTMPQGAALSPDGRTLAVVESGFNPPALALYAVPSLRLLKRVALTGAFGRPLWTPRGVAVAGANADAILLVNERSGGVRTVRLGRGTYPLAIARSGNTFAVATSGDDAVRVAPLNRLAIAQPIHVGHQIGGLAFSSDGKTLFASVQSASYIAAIDVRTKTIRRMPTDLHPGALLVAGNTLYIAQSDADTVAMYDVTAQRRTADVWVGALPGTIGSSPNAIAMQNGALYVSLGAANEIAVIRADRVVARLATGWYPTDVVPAGHRLYVINGKGEGTKPNVGFDVMSRSFHDYIAAIQYGSIRALPLLIPSEARSGESRDGAIVSSQATSLAASRGTGYAVVRNNGPIKHVFFILKENRSYDQILGDMPQGNGDPKLTYFGRRVTPNQHAIAQRFGLFDNFYASGEVSDPGHNWADGAMTTDYVERTWPPAYGNRNDNDEVLSGKGASVPANGYIWDAARRAGVTFRDYGEMALLPAVDGHPPSTAASLGDRYDPRYVGWNLDYSDLDRYKEWKREFDAFVARDAVPQLEYMWLPNDHTYGTRAGKLTPSAYIATNDYVVGMIVDAISHSKIWSSSAVFITEDDAQDGADHVSDQRTTAYVASPYTGGATLHEHYSTVSILRTMELILGLKPLSTYDATALPMYAAFTATPHLEPFQALPYQVDITARNAKVAYGEAISERLDFSGPDRTPPGVLADILDR